MEKITYWDSATNSFKEREANTNELAFIESIRNPVLTLNDFTNALTKHLDSVAQTKNYDNRITCALRAGYAGPFKSEGEAFAIWMDNCNALGYQIMADVSSGARPAPESLAAFISELPAMQWPSQ